MFNFLKRLFAGRSANTLVVEAYWCGATIKLATKMRTPLGSTISVVRVCVDIHYSIENNHILIQRVKMARGGGMMGSNSAINVASDRTGEAWYVSQICHERYLVEAVEQELSAEGSSLRKIMLGKWRDGNRDALVGSLTEALNSQAPPEQIADLITSAGRGNEIVFTYTKPTGEAETRHVTVNGVSGESIRALDHKDGKVKSFRIDRITNARKA